MSIQSAQNFIERIATDESFQQGVINAIGDKEGSAAAQAAVAFGKEFGFIFTSDDLLQARDTVSLVELDGESLDAVTGGGGLFGMVTNAQKLASDTQKRTHDAAMSIIENLG